MRDETAIVYVYRGGSCDNTCSSCGATSTSGSWRKGWDVETGFANLCNRCGQRWAKSVKATGEGQPQSFKANQPSKRTSNVIGIFSEQIPKKYHQTIASASPYVSYSIQRLSAGKAVYCLYWLQDLSGNNTLAVIGSDSSSKGGECAYKSTPGFPYGPPLRSSDPADALAWLQRYAGVSHQVSDSSFAHPALSLEELEWIGGWGDTPRDGPTTPASKRTLFAGHLRQPTGASSDIHGGTSSLSPHGFTPATQRLGPCTLCGALDHTYMTCLASSPRLDEFPLIGSDDDILNLPDADDLPDPACLLSPVLSLPNTALPSPREALEFPDGTSLLTPTDNKKTSENSGGQVELKADARSAFENDANLFQWVSKVPTLDEETKFKEWAEKLGGQISDHPPQPRGDLDMPVGGIQWLPTEEALHILRALSSAETNLQLLQKTSISRAVAMLRTHHVRSISDAAERVVSKWRTVAVDALSRSVPRRRR